MDRPLILNGLPDTTPEQRAQTEKLKELLEKVKDIELTPEQLFEQRISFVYGQVAFSNPSITKDQIRRQLVEAGYGPIVAN